MLCWPWLQLIFLELLILLSITIDCFVPLETCMVTSGTLKASPQGRGSQIWSNSGLLGLVSEVHDVWSNRDLPSMSGRQSMAKATAYVLGVFWTGLYNILSGGFSCLVLRLLLGSLWLLWRALSAQMGKLYSNYIYVCVYSGLLYIIHNFKYKDINIIPYNFIQSFLLLFHLLLSSSLCGLLFTWLFI